MTIKICAIMDPVGSIHPQKDTTLGLLLEAQRRNFSLYYLEQKNLFLSEHKVQGIASCIEVHEKTSQWVTFHETKRLPLSYFDIILMRKDPPFDTAFLYTTYLLEMAKNQGSFIINYPQSIRDANEKLFAASFPACSPEILVTTDKTLLREFLQQHQTIVLKRLNS